MKLYHTIYYTLTTDDKYIQGWRDTLEYQRGVAYARYMAEKRPPTPRPEAYDYYWRFAAERHAVFLRRYMGQPAPWTDDPILQEYKFCNVFRVLDRVSQYLVKEICYSSVPCAPADRLFQIIAFRLFSRIETWERLKETLGGAPTLQHLADGSFERALDGVREAGQPIYTHAFIICANDAFGRGLKHRNHAALLGKMFLQDDIATVLLEAPSLHEVYDILHRYPLYGDFMSYQTAIDLNYSDLINFSENDFVMPGPGAMRGIQKLFVSLGDYSPAELIHWMVRRQDIEFARLDLSFDGLWGRKLHAIDAQGLFCETDKYLRVELPDLASNRSRIKTRFTPTGAPERVFLPPKWGADNDLLWP